MRGTAVVARRAEAMDRGHAEALMPMIEAALAEIGGRLAEIERIGACTGPGSFTGIRVGVAAARGLALGIGCPAVGIDRFAALAAGNALAPGDAGDAAREGAHEDAAIALAAPAGTVFLRVLRGGVADGPDRRLPAADLAAPEGVARLGDGWPGAPAEAGLPDPAAIARLAALEPAPRRPVPYYLRGPNADPPREAPPPLLD